MFSSVGVGASDPHVAQKSSVHLFINFWSNQLSRNGVQIKRRKEKSMCDFLLVNSVCV